MIGYLCILGKGNKQTLSARVKDQEAKKTDEHSRRLIMNSHLPVIKWDLDVYIAILMVHITWDASHAFRMCQNIGTNSKDVVLVLEVHVRRELQNRRVI